MRKYTEDGRKLEKAVCNCCGRELLVENGILKEGICSVDTTWGYFSKKDTMIHHFDLCEDCYDRFTAQFVIPAEVEEETEVGWTSL